eukprot:TRINITY_DN3429_c0_g3_i1.p1 TRINITY_DN3429_c0_g3~~TRINITY_DN3429_c0_g3_i1.p1  ORF type:complete len:431 (+),score=65.76 TRINITY_DN3429_c0_g3_i1:170-1462(+)
MEPRSVFVNTAMSTLQRQDSHPKRPTRSESNPALTAATTRSPAPSREPSRGQRERGQGSSSTGSRSARGSTHERAKSGSPRNTRTRRIMKVTSFKERYKIAGEVMPSTHSYIQVRFAKRIEDNTEVVVKIRMKPACFRTSEDEKSWRRRTETLLNIPMPESIGICKIYEVLEDNEGYYVVMERVRGVDLFEVLEGDCLQVELAREVMRHLLLSLRHLHMYNMVHRDLKLENVMMCPALKTRGKKEKGNPKGLKDLGQWHESLVKIIDFDTLDEWTPKRPNSKDVVGTDQYIAQEAYAGKYSPLSDMFSVGVVMYKLITGKFPFSDDIFEDTSGANWAGSPQMTIIRRRLKVSNVDFQTYTGFRENSMAVDLVAKMLSYNEMNRPTASVALQHPFFKERCANLPNPKGLPDCLPSCAEDLVDDGIIIGDCT